MRELTMENIDELTMGATMLGTGGGGDPYIAALMVRQAIEDYGPVKLVSADELPRDAQVLGTAMVGAPTVMVEKIPAGTEFVGAIRSLANYLGRKPDAIMPIEVGGMNTLIPLAVAAELGLPLVDADGMRRAFPQIEMTVYTLAGIPASPLSLADEKGNQLVFEAENNQMAERFVRGTAMMLGLANAMSAYSLTGQQVLDTSVLGSLTYCMEVGRRLFALQRGDDDAYPELLRFTQGQLMFSGKVIDIERRTTEGFARGTVVLEHIEDADRTMRIEIQNELLIAFEDGRAVVTPPDLICTLDHENAQPITTEGLSYGQRIDVLALPCAPEWWKDGVMELVGPRAFGYDIDYVPIGGDAA